MSIEASKSKHKIGIKDVVSKVSKIFQDISGNVISDFNMSMVENRLFKRFRELNVRTPAEYMDIFNQYPDRETEKIISLLTTHHTFFYRESVQFDFLQKNLKDILKEVNKRADKTLKIWSNACSRGHEVYTLCMILEKYQRDHKINFKYQILGSDIDPECVLFAKNGVYHKSELKKCPEDLVSDNWISGTKEIENYTKITDKIRKNTHFQVINLLNTTEKLRKQKFDLVFCRNVFIYFDQKVAHQISNTIQSHLYDHGLLITGVSESLDTKNCNYNKIGPNIYQNNIWPDKKISSLAKENPSVIKAKDIDTKKQGKAETPSKKKVMIIDDSKTIRTLLTRVFSDSPAFEVVSSIENPLDAIKEIEEHKPDLITLDVHMPNLNGVELLKQYYPEYPIPTIMISSIRKEEGPLIMEALASGAVDYIEKPTIDKMSEVSLTLIDMAKSATENKIKRRSKDKNSSLSASAKHVLEKNKKSQLKIANSLIAIGSSTGGTEALFSILTNMPEKIPPIVIAQHIPGSFSKALADRINNATPFTVKEAIDGEEIQPGTVYIAPGDFHMGLIEKKNKTYVEILESIPNETFKPSADYLFDSVSKLPIRNLVGVILTGMGKDGAIGLKAMKDRGANTFGQNEKTCVVYGMPRAAKELGAVEVETDLHQIPIKVCESLKA